mgnify:CR=1 FL=1
MYRATIGDQHESLTLLVVEVTFDFDLSGYLIDSTILRFAIGTVACMNLGARQSYTDA